MKRFNRGLIFFAALLMVLAGCESQPAKLDISSEKPQEITSEISERHTLTCLIISEDSIYCYRGNNLKGGTYYGLGVLNNFRTMLLAFKKETNDSLTVFLKPTARSTYKNVVDILNEMTIHSIKKYALANSTVEEEIQCGH